MLSLKRVKIATTLEVEYELQQAAAALAMYPYNPSYIHIPAVALAMYPYNPSYIHILAVALVMYPYNPSYIHILAVAPASLSN